MNLHPAYLWVGSNDDLKARCKAFIQQVVCKHNSCGTCADCINLEHDRHYSVLRLAPENYYTLPQLEPVFATLSFVLEPGQHFFFVFEQVQLFNQATANSLLKSLEEPPAGYHFMLLAPRTDGILPTIRSRCIVEVFPSALAQEKHPLFHYFTTAQFKEAAEFSKELEKNKLFESELQELLDHLQEYWHAHLLKAYKKNDQQTIGRAQLISEIISSSRNILPMPGSTKLFLRNLYLNLSLAF